MQEDCTPLDAAAQEGHVDIVQALLRDPRIDPGEKTNVRTQGRGRAVTAGVR